MPIYEYRCGSCGAELEKLQKISDSPLVECPECGRDALVKLISASSFRLKGSGWYETDFKTGNKKNGAAEAPSEGSGSSDTAAPHSANESSKSTGKDGGGGGKDKDAKGSEQKKADTKPEVKAEIKSDKKSTDNAKAGTKTPPPVKP